MDVKTLFILNMINTGFIGLALLFFRSQQKTYPGFGRWTVASWLMCLTYVLIVGRGSASGGLLWLNIFGVNTTVALAALVRLDGTVVFFTGRPTPRPVYLAAPLVGLATVGLTVVWGEAALGWRNLIVSLVVLWCALRSAGLFFFQDQVRGRTLYRVMAGLYLIFCLVFLIRAWDLVVHPNILLMSANMAQQVYLTAVLIIEIGWSLGFLMANSQRLEADLLAVQNRLVDSTKELKAALAEVKTLSGLLPICANCKKIRDDEGYWQRIEGYIESRTEAEFTHGLCPDCIAEFYPELSIDKDGDQ